MKSRSMYDRAPSPPTALERLLISYARRFPVRRGKLRLVDLLWRAAGGGRGTFRVAHLKYGGFKMTCDLSRMLQRQFYFFGTYFIEESLLRMWEQAAGEAATVFDVGANTGIYSLAALGVQPKAVVHAFEPTPELAAHLRSTAHENGLTNLRVHQAAVLSGDGKAALKHYRGEDGSNEGMNFVVSGPGDRGSERVTTVSLDNFCKERAIHRIDLLKLDIQGNEHLALKGAENLLMEGRIGMIFMELNWARQSAPACPAAESVAILEKAGYIFAAPGRRLLWKKAGQWMRGLTDVIAAREIRNGR